MSCDELQGTVGELVKMLAAAAALLAMGCVAIVVGDAMPLWWRAMAAPWLVLVPLALARFLRLWSSARRVSASRQRRGLRDDRLSNHKARAGGR